MATVLIKKLKRSFFRTF